MLSNEPRDIWMMWPSTNESSHSQNERLGTEERLNWDGCVDLFLHYITKRASFWSHLLSIYNCGVCCMSYWCILNVHTICAALYSGEYTFMTFCFRKKNVWLSLVGWVPCRIGLYRCPVYNINKPGLNPLQLLLNCNVVNSFTPKSIGRFNDAPGWFNSETANENIIAINATGLPRGLWPFKGTFNSAAFDPSVAGVIPLAAFNFIPQWLRVALYNTRGQSVSIVNRKK